MRLVRALRGIRVIRLLRHPGNNHLRVNYIYIYNNNNNYAMSHNRKVIVGLYTFPLYHINIYIYIFDTVHVPPC